MNNRKTGSRYEEKAAAYLERQGYRVLEKNFRCSRGEIDLICRDGRYLVFVEVKYRSSPAMGSPAESVNRTKQERIRQTAVYYLYVRRFSQDTPCRFDVVAILGERIELFRDAF